MLAKQTIKAQPNEGLLDDLKNKGLLLDRAYINGEWVGARGQDIIEVKNPADGSVLGTVPSLDEGDVKKAIDSAEDAFSIWSNTPPRERASKLRLWADLMLAEREDLALIMTLEQGKPLAESLGEIDYAASFFDWFAGEAERTTPVGVTPHLTNTDMQVYREPVGVAALITPWNFPSAMITRKAAAALAVGCTVVVKPASETPFSALALSVLAEKAGIPAGVFNVITGSAPKLAKVLCDDTRVRALSFTGSTGVGRTLLEWSAPTVKRMSMELGGHAPFIVCADVDLEKAVNDAIDAKFQTTGQDCLAANRIYVHKSIYDEFVSRFSDATKKLKVGDGLTPGVQIGPLMNEGAVKKCKEQIDDAIAKGAKLLVGGNIHKMGGLFFAPTVLTDVSPEMMISYDETFGPVAAISSFEDEEEVIRLANNTEYGLAAYVQTTNSATARRISGKLEFGMVAVNCVKMTGGPIPFGGMKQSGIGREGGSFGMDSFSDIKYVCTSTKI